MTIYDPNNVQHSLLVAQWWAIAQQDGDLDLMMMRNSHALGQFFKRFEPPNILVFDTDDLGIWLAAWFTPMMTAAFYSLWIRPDRRGRETVPYVLQTYEMGFKVWPVLLGVTKQERLLRNHERLGYRIVGPVSRVFDGEDGWLVELTKESFDGHRQGRQPANVGQPGA
jgi:hypothetical protein